MVDVGLGVSGGDEGGFELAAREVDAAGEHFPEEAGEEGCVGAEGVGVVADGAVVEEEGEHAADALDAVGNVGVGAEAVQAVGEAGSKGFEAVVGWLGLKELEGGQSGGHRQRISGEGASLEDGSGRGDEVHGGGGAAVGGSGQAAADDFAEGGQVGGDAVALLGAAGREPEAGHDLVEEQQGAVLAGQFAEALEVSGIGGNETHVAGDRFEEYGRDLTGEGLEDLGDGVGVVEFDEQGIGRGAWGDAGAVGGSESGGGRSGLNEQSVDVAMIMSFHFDKFGACGGGTGEADGRHGGFGSGGDEANLVDRGDHAGDGFGDFGLALGRGAEAGTRFEGRRDGGFDRRVAVPEDHGAPGADVINVLMIVDIPKVSALGAGDERRFAADGAEGAGGAVDAAGDDAVGADEGLVAAGQAEVGSGACGGGHGREEWDRAALGGGESRTGNPGGS